MYYDDYSEEDCIRETMDALTDGDWDYDEDMTWTDVSLWLEAHGY
ncbi:MAG: hypothetical protein U9Q98_05490 [Bacteroidota bacterium]|nr:hypothetical protein [Bacteroidota bacterium]